MFLLCDSLHSIQSNWVLILSAEIGAKNEITVLQDDKERTEHLLKEGPLVLLAGVKTRQIYCDHKDRYSRSSTTCEYIISKQLYSHSVP
jgi:hypothetical protein